MLTAFSRPTQRLLSEARAKPAASIMRWRLFSLVCFVAVVLLLAWLAAARHATSTGVAPAWPKDCPPAIEIRLTAAEHRWRVVYPETDAGRVVIEDLRAAGALHVPLDAEIAFVLNSHDYLYTLSAPDFDRKQIAVPGREFRLMLRPSVSGTYSLVGEELCGLGGDEGAGRIVVEPYPAYRAWLERRSLTP